MKILYFDCFSGISGDMVIGALLDLGIDTGRFMEELGKLGLSGFELAVEKKAVCGITGTDFNVACEPHMHAEDRNHSHNHSHNHGHVHEARNLRDIEKIINNSELSRTVKTFSREVFTEIARAEGKVHGKPEDEVHFHEVGAVDSIVDIVGTAICLELLGDVKIYSSPLHDGNGTIECRHGIIPVPVPAVLEMLAGSGIPYITEDIGTELVTPTGMGLIKHMAAGFGNMPAMKVEKTGYGMGKRETGRLNALRVVLGEVYEAEDTDGRIAVLETNMDDISPEILGYTMGKLYESGALEVFYTPVFMKKNRPACMLTVLARREDEKKLADIILSETTTIGIRRSLSDRYVMERQTCSVTTEFGEARIKLATGMGVKKASPEYEDCRKIAEAQGIPLAQVYEKVMENARKQIKL